MIFLFGIFLLFTLIQICYHLCIFQKIAFYQPPQYSIARQELPVSIIICAKNEAKNLAKFLPAIFTQNYDNYQVVLVNDRSNDNTLEILEKFEQKYPDKTKIINIACNDNPIFHGNKKYALSLGIKAAKNPYLLFTDADCQIASDNWIRRMIEAFGDKNTEIVLGYGKYQAKDKSFLNKLIRYETLQTALQYFSYSLKGFPYMGVGRNLAYTKELFMENNGFFNHIKILSGDDDLFVNENATAQNTNICIHPDSFTISQPKRNLKAYLYQKRRHISTAKHYQFKHKMLLIAYFISSIGFWIIGFALLAQLFLWKIVLIMIFIRFGIAFIINYKTAQKLQETDLVWFLPILELSLISLQFYIFMRNFISRPKTWR